MKFRNFLILIVFSLSQLFVNARELGGIQMAEHLHQGDKTLYLNGGAVFSKYIFDVYAVGLYLESKSNNVNYILNEDKPFIIRMHLLRDVESEKLMEGLVNGFRYATNGKEYKLKKEIHQLSALFPDEYVKENDVLQFDYKPGIGTRISCNGKQRISIPGYAFKKAVLGIWLGSDPKLVKVKQKLLGL